ncbi:Uncharacterized protein APZ42_004937 [Daphnia magna]|uniref:Uncharacterized protein n=1 Tax=Daphnia magna TaxID=35525 RepID=A0A162CUA6_9CRUS|nr:Uncharacterized protein APZ42_004937 [Daphnia magna]
MARKRMQILDEDLEGMVRKSFSQDKNLSSKLDSGDSLNLNEEEYFNSFLDDEDIIPGTPQQSSKRKRPYDCDSARDKARTQNNDLAKDKESTSDSTPTGNNKKRSWSKNHESQRQYSVETNIFENPPSSLVQKRYTQSRSVISVRKVD